MWRITRIEDRYQGPDYYVIHKRLKIWFITLWIRWGFRYFSEFDARVARKKFDKPNIVKKTPIYIQDGTF
jgi:hypothetical protein